MTNGGLFSGKKKKWYGYLVPGGAIGVTNNWRETEKQVSGKKGARYRSFETQEDAEKWLKSGAQYESKSIKKKEIAKKLEPGVYFDAGTGRGHGVEISVTDEKGKNLLHEAIKKKELNKFGKYLIENSDATNNYGELLALRYALTIAIENDIKKVFGDSKLVIDYWSKWRMKRSELPEETVRLANEVAALREEFEKEDGSVERISGDYNPADLGFHR